MAAINLGTTTSGDATSWQCQRKIAKTSTGKLILFAQINEVIQYKTSDDGGATWSGSWTTVFTPTSFTYSFDVYIDTSNDIYLVFDVLHFNRRLYFKKLTWTGAGWTLGANILIGAGITPDMPTITKRSNGDLWVSTFNSGTNDINTYYSSDTGSTWNPGGSIVTTCYACCIIPHGANLWMFAIELGKVRVYEYIAAWDAGTDIDTGVTNSSAGLSALRIADNDIRVAVRTASGVKVYSWNGAVWDAGALLSDNASDTTPAIGEVNSKPAVIWTDFDGVNYNVAYRNFDGSIWKPQVDVTSDALSNYDTSCLAIDSAAFFFCWTRGLVSPFDVMFETTTFALQETIQSDAQISGSTSINSDAQIVNYRASMGILSDAEISPPSPQQTIGSSARIKVEDIQETIESYAFIVSNRIGKSILSTAQITVPTTTLQETIDSTAEIRAAATFDCKCQVYKEHEKDFDAQLKVNQPSPTNPTGLSATDLQTGEALELTWTDTGNYGYNVYKDVGGSWVLQNSSPLVGNVSYVAGTLTTGVSYTFQVRGVNGQGDESTGVNTSGTPTFNQDKYATRPIFQIYIGGVENTDAVLQRVELVYGPFSRALFYIPKRPDTIGLPDANNQAVVVKINNRQVFSGYLIKKEDIYSASDLRANYTAVNELWDLTRDTVGRNFNEPMGYQVKSIDINTVLRKSGCLDGLPTRYIYGEVSTGNMTKLEVMQSMIRWAGNYKIYCSPTGAVSYYKVGSPIHHRTYEIGKHILDERLTKDITNKINSVTVHSDYKRVTVSQAVSYRQGTNTLEFTLVGKNISNVQVYAKVNQEPRVLSYIPDFEVLPAHVNLQQWPEGEVGPRRSVKSYEWYELEWQSAGAKVEYSKDGWRADVKVSPIPTVYYADLDYYDAKFIVMDPETNAPKEVTQPVFIWDKAWQVGAELRVVYTYETSRLTATAGTPGLLPHRDYFEGVVPYTINVSSDLNYRPELPRSNTGAVSNYLSDKANAEYERLALDQITGSISVLGDETLDLRTHVNGLEVMRVIHDFSNGFVTHLDLTNEQFYRGQAQMRQIGMLEVKEKSRRDRAHTNFIAYDFSKIENLAGLLKDYPGQTTPDGSISIYSD